ncbi:MAG TPA: protein kinase, partial [Thermoanaerobaculia bacterium]
MQVNSGTKLGPYEIVSRIGAGGMGEVWRARDTRLDRNVAIKILPSDFATNAQLKLRFEREAKAISQFAHPNICTLHDVGSDNGTDYLVMELLDGESLADRVARGPLPLGDVLRYGAQIAAALDRAHRAGIVHRDLKPGNVMLTSSGAKLLDFGLAKTATLQLTPDDVTQQQHKALTQEGTIVGTFQYMSPEQLEGVAVDHRTDIFALGAVLYEMATGRRAFDGKTKTSLIAAIVSAEPKPVADLTPTAPRALDHVIRRCLQKDPEQRWQSAHDIADELTWIATELGTPEQQAKKAKPLTWIALLLLAATLGAAAMYLVRGRTAAPRDVSFTILPPPDHQFAAPILSPAGDAIAFDATDIRGETSLWIRTLGSIEGRRITEPVAGGRVYRPFWSPDGKWIAYIENRKLVKVPATGGRPEVIAKEVGYGVGNAWSSKGTILWTRKWGEGLYRVQASGGELVPVTQLDRKRREAVHAWPAFLPDEDHFVYLVRTIAEQKNEIYAGSLSKPLKKAIVKADSLIGFHDGWLLYVRDGNAYAHRFDVDALAVEGDPQKIVEGVMYDEDSANSYASVARDGGLLYLPASNTISKWQLAWHDLTGRLTEKVLDDTSITTFRLSPDETKIALAKIDPAKGANDVYTYDIARGVTTKITGGLSNHRSV